MHAVQTSTRHNFADAPRPGERSWDQWAMGAEKGAVIGVYVAAKISEESPALGLALARAGVLGAAARLAQHWVSASPEAMREGKACAAALRMHYLLQAINRHLPQVCARFCAAHAHSACRPQLNPLTLHGRCGRTAC